MIERGENRNAETRRAQSYCRHTSSALSASPRFKTCDILFLTKTKKKRVRGAAVFRDRLGEVLFIARKLGYMVDRVLRAFTDEVGNAETLRAQSFWRHTTSALSASPRFKTCDIWFLTKTKKKRVRGAAVFRDRPGEVLFIDARKLDNMVDRVLRAFIDKVGNAETLRAQSFWRHTTSALSAFQNLP